ncbi:MAG: hypothetical protein V1886_00785 [archaeon]
MEIKLRDKKHNIFLDRDEITVTVISDATPKTEQVKKEVSAKFNISEDAIAIKRIKGNFGRKEFEIEAYAYKDKEAFEKSEPKSKSKKADTAQDAAKAEEKK